MLCLKMSLGLLRIREPSGAEGLFVVPFSLADNRVIAFAALAVEELNRRCIYSVKTYK